MKPIIDGFTENFSDLRISTMPLRAGEANEKSDLLSMTVAIFEGSDRLTNETISELIPALISNLGSSKFHNIARSDSFYPGKTLS